MFFHHTKINNGFTLRNEILGAIEAGDKPTDISVRCGCHINSIYRLMNNFLATGSADDLPKTGRPKVTDPHQDRAIATFFRREPFRRAAEVAIQLLAPMDTPERAHRPPQDPCCREVLPPPCEKAIFDGSL